MFQDPCYTGAVGECKTNRGKKPTDSIQLQQNLANNLIVTLATQGLLLG